MSENKELKKTLESIYKYKTELHAHTSPVSTCSTVSAEEMAQVYHNRGYDAIVITNHFTHKYFANMEKEAALDYYLNDFENTKKEGEKLGLTVLLGTEIRFDENSNDYLIFGVDRQILSDAFDYFEKGVEYFRKNYKMPKSVFLQAHPFRDKMEHPDLALLDGIEVFNMHPGHNARAAIAERYACENNLKIRIAGSDFHHIEVHGDALTALRTKTLPKDSFELAKILKSGDFILQIGDETLLLP